LKHLSDLPTISLLHPTSSTEPPITTISTTISSLNIPILFYPIPHPSPPSPPITPRRAGTTSPAGLCHK
jgi:hypothetical protein